MLKAVPIIYRNYVYIYASKERQVLRIPTGIKAQELNSKGLINKTCDENYEEKNLKILEKLNQVQQVLRDYPMWSIPDVVQFIKTGLKPQEKSTKAPDLLQVCEMFRQASESGERKTSRGLTISSGTLRNYGMIYSKFLQFSRTYDLSRWENINDAFYSQYCKWCWYTLENTDSTVGRDIIYLRTVIKWGLETGVIEQPIDIRNWKAPKEEQTDIFVMYADEIKLLYSMPISITEDSVMRESIPKRYVRFNENRLCQIRDCFLMGVFTCFRISELMSLREDDLVISGNEWYIYRVVKKTKTPIKIKLNAIGVEIIRKYRHQYQTLLPYFTDMTFNNNLRKLAIYFKEYLSIHLVTNPDKNLITNDWSSFKRIRTRNGVHYTEFLKPEDILSSHTMRRSGITNLLMMGLSEWEVRAISQHKSEAFYKYVKVAQQLTENKHTNVWETALSQN